MLAANAQPGRRPEDATALREILAGLETHHVQARDARLTKVRAALAMTIGLVRDELRAAEDGARQAAPSRLGGFLRRLGDP